MCGAKLIAFNSLFFFRWFFFFNVFEWRLLPQNCVLYTGNVRWIVHAYHTGELLTSNTLATLILFGSVQFRSTYKTDDCIGTAFTIHQSWLTISDYSFYYALHIAHFFCLSVKFTNPPPSPARTRQLHQLNQFSVWRLVAPFDSHFSHSFISIIQWNGVDYIDGL